MQATGSLNLKSTSEYKNIPLEVVLQSLEAATDGLPDSEAGNRLKKFGYNEIIETRKNLMGSTAERVLGHASFPVLIVKP